MLKKTTTTNTSPISLKISTTILYLYLTLVRENISRSSLPIFLLLSLNLPHFSYFQGRSCHSHLSSSSFDLFSLVLQNQFGWPNLSSARATRACGSSLPFLNLTTSTHNSHLFKLSQSPINLRIDYIYGSAINMGSFSHELSFLAHNI